MSVELKTGSLNDLFASAKETAKEIDEGKKITPKNIVWVEPHDLMAILKPERTRIVKYLRKKQRVVFSELMAEMRRTPVSLNNDLKILSRYQLVKIFKEPNPGHGIHKVIESTYGNEKIEFKAEI
ncbi:transcriptional regulator [Candidatus Electrothrix sp.]|uniref:transcriptional regulator n=1 Tax=Candidatus Electrothrix sp. TaxID=2170559 RepID=UPI00405735B3